LVPIAFGLDTCGGVRTPAAFQGLFGFRMGTNSYAREGIFPIAPSIESIGAFTASIGDMLAAFGALHRLDQNESTESPCGALLTELAGISTELAIKKGLYELTRNLHIEEEPSVVSVLKTELAHSSHALSTIRSRELYSIHQYWLEEYSAQYDPILLQKIEKGRNCTAFEVENAAAQQVKVRSAFTRFFDDYDYLVMPICHELNPERRRWNEDFEESMDDLLAPASLAFLPAIILPLQCGPERFAAAQVIVNPRKLGVIPKIAESVSAYYEGDSGVE
ncbi:MAG: amidase family protein, partial [Verrucomicrobiota bacterium]